MDPRDGLTANTLDPLQFYAVNGFYDINFDYTGNNGYQGGIMHCNSGYSDSCWFANDSFSCNDRNTICNYGMEYSPTSEPSMEPTAEPILQNMGIIIAIISSFAAILCVITFIICIRRRCKSDQVQQEIFAEISKDKIHHSLQSVESATLEDQKDTQIMDNANATKGDNTSGIEIMDIHAGFTDIGPDPEVIDDEQDVITKGQENGNKNEGKGGDDSDGSYHSSHSDAVYPYKYAVQKETSFYGLKDDVMEDNVTNTGLHMTQKEDDNNERRNTNVNYEGQ